MKNKYFELLLFIFLIIGTLSVSAANVCYGNENTTINILTGCYNATIIEGTVNKLIWNCTIPSDYQYASGSTTGNSSGFGVIQGSSEFAMTPVLTGTSCTMNCAAGTLNCAGQNGSVNNWTFSDDYIDLNTTASVSFRVGYFIKSGDTNYTFNGSAYATAASVTDWDSALGTSAMTFNNTVHNNTLIIVWDENVITDFDYSTVSSPQIFIGRGTLVSAGTKLNQRIGVRAKDTSLAFPNDYLSVIGAFKNATLPMAPPNSTLYVNGSNPNCNSSNLRGIANNSATPWCDIDDAFSKVWGGDTVIIANGQYRQTSGYSYSANTYTYPVSYIGQSSGGVNLTSGYIQYENTTNGQWNNASTASINLWNSTTITNSGTVACHYLNNMQPIFVYSSYSALISTSGTDGVTTEGTYWDNTNKVLWIKMNSTNNPNTTALSCSRTSVLSLTGVNNAHFHNLTFLGGYPPVAVKSSSTPSKNIDFSYNEVIGGHGISAVDFRYVTNVTIGYNEVHSSRPSDWMWEDMKTSLAQEISAIGTRSAREGVIIRNNNVSGYFNGIMMYTDALGQSYGLTCINNIIRDMYDDALELEDYGNAYNISNNDVLDTYQSISMAPFNSSQNRSIIEYNLLLSNKMARITPTSSIFGVGIKALENDAINNVTINQNTFYTGQGIYGKDKVRTISNSNITNNLFYAFDSYVLYVSGLASRGTYYDYNAYYSNNSLPIFKNWNNDTNNVTFTTLTSAKASSQNPGWDNHSINTEIHFFNPVAENFSILTGYPECNGSNTGSYIGARACVNDSSVLIVYINESQNESVWGNYNNGSYNFYFTENRNRQANCTLYLYGVGYNKSNNLYPDTIYTMSLNQSVTNGEYEAWINCTTSYGTESKSSVLNLTIEAPTQRVTELTLASRDTNWLYLTWTNPEIITWNHNEVWLNDAYYATTTNAYINITGLIDGTSYNITIRAYDTDFNYGSTSIIVSTRTFPVVIYNLTTLFSSGASVGTCDYNTDPDKIHDGDFNTFGLGNSGGSNTCDLTFTLPYNTINASIAYKFVLGEPVYYDHVPMTNTSFTTRFAQTAYVDPDFYAWFYTIQNGTPVLLKEIINGNIFNVRHAYDVSINPIQQTTQELAITSITTVNGSTISSATVYNLNTSNSTTGTLPLYLAMANGTQNLIIETMGNWNKTITYTSAGNETYAITGITNTYIYWNNTETGTASQTPTCSYNENFTENITRDGNYYYLMDGTYTIYCKNIIEVYNYSINKIVGTPLNITLTLIDPIINITQDCGTSNNALFFQLKDEQNLTNLAGNIYNYRFVFGLALQNYTYFGSFNSTNNFSLCIKAATFPNWTLEEGEIFYSSNGYENRRYYVFSGTRLTSTQTNVTLYNLASTESTTFTLTVESTSLQSYVDKYVGLVRWYPNYDQYEVVDMGKTDDIGETVVHIEVEDVDYRIAVWEKNGSLIYLSSPKRFVCLTTPCTFTLKIQPSDVDYTSILNIQKSFTYDDTTGIWRFVFNDPSQNTNEINMTIYKDTGATSYVICNSQVSGYAGAVMCNTSDYTGNLRGEITKINGVIEIHLDQLLATAGTTSVFKSSFGLFLSFILALPILCILVVISPIAGIAGGILALVPAWYFGSILFAIFACFIIMGGIAIHFIKRASGR